MANLESYQYDGADNQARAVLAFLQGELRLEKIIINNETNLKIEAGLSVSRWENFREQGYVISLTSPDYKKQLNIVFFEHRNSDIICAVKWFQTTLNAPTIDMAKFGDVYKDKYDTSFNVGYGEIKKMSDWIKNEFEGFWNNYEA